MPTAAADLDQDVRVAITLACLTYLAEGKSAEIQQATMRAALAQPDLPTAARWEIVWGPYKHETNLWYVAVGPNAQNTRTIAIVIRGTQMHKAQSLWEDLEVEPAAVPWFDPTAPAGATIATGFKHAFDRLMAAQDPYGQHALDYVRGLLYVSGPNTVIHVTGHSLGGALAPLLALYVKHKFPKTVVRSFPFGGQMTGNAAFAQWYAREFDEQPSCWINALDVIPMFYRDVDRVEGTYGPTGPPCPSYIKDVLYLDPFARAYTPLPNPAIFTGKLYSKTGWFAWEQEASSQHQHLYYMYLAGIPESVIRAGLGPCWCPPPGASD